MKPIPVAFHIGPLEVHTYGIGLAVTFLFALWYFQRRLRNNGYPHEWLNQDFLWIIASAIVGARVVHVLANLSSYTADPGQIVAIWQGGLSSYGGLLFGVPTGLWLVHRHCPQLGLWRALDLLSPVLMAAWALGRLLGPQLMVAGGGHPTTSWIGLEYAGQVGKRLPVPLFQAAENFAVFLILLAVERWSVRNGGPTGLLLAVMLVLWDIERFFDELLWIANGWDPVEGAASVLAIVGLFACGLLLYRWKRSRPSPTAPAVSGGDMPPETHDEVLPAGG